MAAVAALNWSRLSMQPSMGDLSGARPGGSEEGSLLFRSDPECLDVGVEVSLGGMVRRHLVEFAAFLVKPKPPPLPVLVKIGDIHAHDGADAREAVDHDRDQREVP